MVNNLHRILIAEDSEKDLELMLSALDEHHLANEVIAVRDGTEVLDFLYRRGPFQTRGNGNPAFIVLDIKMPKMDGIEVLGRLKADEQFKSIPVVMLTSSREERDLVESYKLGANAFVVKPVDFREFVQAVKELGLFWAVLNEAPPGSIGRS